jgi:hypothetical protein
VVGMCGDAGVPDRWCGVWWGVSGRG